MKKIAIIVKNTTFNKSFGGLEVHTKSLIELLCKDFQIDIFAPKRELKNLILNENNKNYYFIDTEYRTGFFSDFFRKNWNFSLYSFFKEKYFENKYDLVISISSAGYPLLNKKNEFDCKFLTISHGTAYSEFKSLYNEGGISFSLLKNTPYFIYNYFFKQRNFIKNSDYVVCVSDFVRNNLILETNSKEIHKFKTIFNGVGVDNTFDKEFDNLSKLKIIFAGRVEVSKGILVLLESIKGLETHLYIAGDGTALEKSKRFVFENKLSDKVTFLGKLTSENLHNYYKESDLLIVPSLRVEGFPMSIIEGMSYYLPVIASKIGGNVDAVIDNKTGFLVTPGDARELSDKINFFNTYPEKIKELGINARNLVSQRFSNEGMIKEYLEVINKLLK
jgi:glycosyltransferase involved in cell wall biosynthesis